MMMTTPLIAELEELQRLLRDAPVPRDDHKYHFFLRPRKLLEEAQEEFSVFIEGHFENLVGGRNNTAADSLRRHLQWIFLGLAQAALNGRWLLVSLTKDAYANDAMLKRFGFKHAPVKAIVDYLEHYGLAIVIRGRKYQNSPARTRLYPNPELAGVLVKFHLQSCTTIQPPYVVINEPTGEWKEVIAELPSDHPDRQEMIQINDFLKGHTWACKGPVQLKYKHDVFSSGRLYTDYQDLPDRRVRIRINTLIDGEPLCEVDFSANHLRLAMSVLHDEDIGDTPYEDIMEIAQLRDRSLVKTFVTRALGADSRTAANSGWNKEKLGARLFEQIELAVMKRFPKLKLYDAWGIQAQNLEGAMLRHVMLQGIEKDIVCLPVHDAIAVPQLHEKWAVEAMLEAWERIGVRNASSARARVKVDRP